MHSLCCGASWNNLYHKLNQMNVFCLNLIKVGYKRDVTWREFYREGQEWMHSFYIAFSVVESRCKQSAYHRFQAWPVIIFHQLKLHCVINGVCFLIYRAFQSQKLGNSEFRSTVSVYCVCGQWQMTGTVYSSLYASVARQTTACVCTRHHQCIEGRLFLLSNLIFLSANVLLFVILEGMLEHRTCFGSYINQEF